MTRATSPRRIGWLSLVAMMRLAELGRVAHLGRGLDGRGFWLCAVDLCRPACWRWRAGDRRLQPRRCRCRARPARSGSSSMRTAYFWLPKIETWATPCEVDSAGEITCWAKSSSCVSGSDVAARAPAAGSAASAGIDLAVGRRRRHLDRQLALDARDRRLHVGRGGVDVAVEVELRARSRSSPGVLVALIVSMPAMVSNCLISGVATEFAIVSGEAPGS